MKFFTWLANLLYGPEPKPVTLEHKLVLIKKQKPKIKLKRKKGRK